MRWRRGLDHWLVEGEQSGPMISAASLGDSNTGMHLAIGILTAYIGRQQTGKGQKVAVAMQDAVLNLCRLKMRDQLCLDTLGHLEGYAQYPNESFSDVIPRGGNAGGGGQPGWILKCKGWETDPNAYIYFTVQGHAWEPVCDAIGKPEWKTDPMYTTAKARQPHITNIFAAIETWLKDKTKFEAVDILRKFDIPCAPVLSIKELLNDPSLRASGSIVEVPHKERGSYFTVGSPIKFSDLKRRLPLTPAGRAYGRGIGGIKLLKRTNCRHAHCRCGLRRARPAPPPASRFYGRRTRKRPPRLTIIFKVEGGSMSSALDFRRSVDAVGDAVIAADANGAVILWNHAATRLFGFTPEEALGQSLDLITPHQHQKRHWDGYYKTMRSGETKYGHDVLKVPAVHRDGHSLSIDFTVSLLWSSDKKVSSIVAVIRDETARFVEKRALRKRLTELENHKAIK